MVSTVTASACIATPDCPHFPAATERKVALSLSSLLPGLPSAGTAPVCDRGSANGCSPSLCLPGSLDLGSERGPPLLLKVRSRKALGHLCTKSVS